jgi:hypothetical protein
MDQDIHALDEIELGLDEKGILPNSIRFGQTSP